MSTEPATIMKFGITDKYFTLKRFSVSLFMEINKQTKGTVWHQKFYYSNNEKEYSSYGWENPSIITLDMNTQDIQLAANLQSPKSYSYAI